MKKPTIGINSIIDKQTTFGDNVSIGNNVIIQGKVSIGANTRIDHNSIIQGNVIIGKNNWIYPSCVIGTGPEHVSFREDPNEKYTKTGRIVIGTGNVIREFITIHLPTVKQTKIGSDCYIQARSHIAHDVTVHDNVTIANQVALGGHSEVFDNATIGLATQIHQYCKIGSHSMIGMCNAISKDVLPFSLINKREFTKINTVGLTRNKIKKNDILKIKYTYEHNFPVKTAKTWYEREIKDFVKKSTRGYYIPKL